MKKFRFIFKALTEMDYKSLFKVTGKVAKKAHKSYIATFVDVVKCGFKYQAGYYDYQEFEFYLLNDEQRETMLTRGKNNSIISRYNNKEYFHYFSNKIEFNNTFKDYMKRDFIDIEHATLDEFKKFMEGKEYFMAKEVDNMGGVGITKIKVADHDPEELLKELRENKQYLCEEMIIQNSEINKIYPGSINTVRLFTFFDGEEAHVLQSIFRLGNGGGFVDNFSSGGMYTFLDDNGVVMVPAIDKDDNYMSVHPQTGAQIVGFKLPLYDKACEMVKEAAKVIPEVKYVGWDVAIMENDVCLVEGNEFPGVFQPKPSFLEKPEGILPKYAKYIKF